MGNERALRVVVVGAGMSGILAAIKLREAGIEDVRVYEKADRLGGTWRDNTYPGLSCDVPSQLYSYSFALNPDWSHRFSFGQEIWTYLDTVAEQHGVKPLIRYGKEVTSARYENGRWQLETGDGQRDVADVVIAATGVLHHPVYPDIPGRRDFAGPSFHTARWDHRVPIQGKRVGIIGTGSSAIQIVPAIVDRVGRVSLFQRTAQWILPLPNPPFTAEERSEFRRSPEMLEEAYRAWNGKFNATFARAVIGDERERRRLAEACEANLAENVDDPELRRALTPDYEVACKRLIMSDVFYPAIARPNAELVTTRIERVEAGGVRTGDGRLHELDVLVYATGFDAHRFLRPMQVVGDGGKTLEAAWSEANEAHRSVAVPGFPNLFLLIGPNSPIGNFSLIMVAEMQIAYILQLVGLVREGRCQAVVPKAAAARRFNDAIRAAMPTTVWATGCRSWYLDKHGNPAMWPWSFEKFEEEMARPALEEFDLLA